MQKWEYKVVLYLDEDKLNELGQWGWELVAVTFDSAGVRHGFYFKRPL